MDNSLLVNSNLNLFEQKPVLKSYVNTTDVTINPNDGWKEGQLIEFSVPKYDSLMYESDSFELHTVLKFINADGTPIDDSTQVYVPINGIGITLFEYITVQVGNTLICGENKTDVYKNYLSILLGNSVDSKKTWVQQQSIWYQDTAGAFNDLAKISKNKGYLARFTIFNGGSEVHTSTKIPYPLGQTRNLLIPGIVMKFSLKKAISQFAVITNSPAKNMEIKIEKIWIKARARGLEAPLYNALVSKLRETDARYSFVRPSMYGPTQLPAENLSFNFTIFRETCPMTVLVFFVRCDSFLGSYSLNPLELIKPAIKSAWIEIEGQRYPNMGYVIPPPYNNPDPSSAQNREVFLELYRILQQQNGVDSGITFGDFLNGYHLMAFQISDNLPSDAYVVDRKRGDTNLVFEFSEAYTQPLYLMALGTFESTIFISGTNGVLKNYTI